jgi:anti-sigma regulatory factor (Ser/Thr protein kinase)
MNVRMIVGGRQSRLRIDDTSQVGEIRRLAQRLAESHDFDETTVGRVGIVATELANNVLRHAERGELLVQTFDDGHRLSVELVALDKGPGMNVEACMRDGYSTFGTAGNGLGAISRLSTFFDVYSAADQGTVAVARISKQPTPAARTEGRIGTPNLGAICTAVAGEIECGDAWQIASKDRAMAIMVADGLGHGPLAAVASQAAVKTFEEDPFERPSDAMQRIHRKLSGGRGAAAAVAVVEWQQSSVSYAGVGNISGAVVASDKSKGMVSHNGILGVKLLRTQQFEYGLAPDSKIVMHSDGMSARWSLSAYPGLSVRHASVIAGVLFRDHARARDDVTIVVAGAP